MISKLHNKSALKKLGKPKFFLGIEVHDQPYGAIVLTQTNYIKDLLAKTNMTDANGANTPILNHCKLSKHDINVLYDPSIYKSAIRALQYVTLT